MTGEKITETRMRCYNTLCVPYISLDPSLHALYMTVDIAHLILVSVRFSPVIPISYQNICKMFLFTSLYHFFSPNFERAKVSFLILCGVL